VARVPFVGRHHRTQSPLFSGLNGDFELRIKGSSPSMFQSDFPSGPRAALFKTAKRPTHPPLLGLLIAEPRVCARPLVSCSDPNCTHHPSTSLWLRVTSAHDATPYGLQSLGLGGCGLHNRSNKFDTDGTLARQLGQVRRPCLEAASLIGAP